ncbi:MAG: tetratricopeptide repeat protein [Sphingobacteriia bacterium]|nr:tetratricopeptide repeat protein [Sphingobacteriia bacterium]NCC40642.1 tetratricopeptide repeat protein [Gammaproteobacteria bacterium]
MFPNHTARYPEDRAPLLIDDAPLDAILYGAPGSPSSVDLFAVHAVERAAISQAWTEGRTNEALRRTDDLLASGGVLTEGETFMTLMQISQLIPECGWPLIPADAYPYHSILREIFGRALRAGRTGLVGSVGPTLARALEARGRFDGSAEVFRTLLTGARLRRSRIDIAACANNLGYTLTLQGCLPEAERCCEEAIAGFTAVDAPSRANNARANLLTARLDLDGFPDAVALEPEIEEVDTHYLRAADWRRRKTLVLLARIREHLGDLHSALELMEKALRSTRDIRTQHRRADATYRDELMAALECETSDPHGRVPYRSRHAAHRRKR